MERVREVCENNGGVYVRIGQILSSMTGVLPEDILSPLRQLNSYEPGEIPYERMKMVLEEGIKKPMKEIFDGFQTKPFKTGLFHQSHRSILL